MVGVTDLIWYLRLRLTS